MLVTIPLVLELIDSETGSVAETIDLGASNEFVDSTAQALKRNFEIELDEDATEKFMRERGLSSIRAKARVRRKVKADELLNPNHTGRELLMMLRGGKPLAVFGSLDVEEMGDSVLMGQHFSRFVEKGVIKSFRRSIRLKRTGPDGRPHTANYLLFTALGEEWRVDAYILLMKFMDEIGWCEHLEQLEGMLLGYTANENAAHLLAWSGRSLCPCSSNGSNA